jgi:glycosyltransferase involved in cell wall biosynthesis
MQAFATGLVERGHEVEVICEVPNHPQGVIDPAYRGSAVVRRRMDGIQIRYVWVRTSPQKTMATRLQLYGSYAAMAVAVGSASPRPDVILATSPPLPVATAAAALAVRHRVPWVMDVRDLWPDVAIVLGELSNPAAIRTAEWLERRLYESASAIVTVSEPFRREIAEKTADPEKIAVVPNGTTQPWLDAAGLDVDKSEFGLPEDRFVWTYPGNVGLAQGLEAAVDAAGLLGDGYTLAILGDGPMLAGLKQRASALPPGAVEFRDPVQPPQARRAMRASDALLVSLGGAEELRKYVPSKLFDCCALGRPVILAAAGESARLAGEAEAALIVPPADPSSLAQAVRSLESDEALRASLSESGRAFAAAYLREKQVGRLEELLAAAVTA